jgi:DNA excision repair protein ERCC-2
MRFFPFVKVRPVQEDCISVVEEALKKRGHVIMHAPTGLGKTAATLVPATEFALSNNKTVFFLTSRNTQHQLAVETVRLIKETSGADFTAVDIVGKQWMCSLENVSRLHSSEFADYCEALRSEGSCIFYEHARGTEFGLFVQKMKDETPIHAEQLVEACKMQSACAYEVAAKLASQSLVVIADYFYLFHPHIRNAFLKKIRKDLENCIVIVDEAHNLPQRIRSTLTSRLSSHTLLLSKHEARKFDAGADKLVLLVNALSSISKGLPRGAERLVTRESFISAIDCRYDELLAELSGLAEEIREQQQKSFVGRVAAFLETWQSNAAGYTRILESREFQGKPNLVLSRRCLDPAVASREVIEGSHSTILMSGTLAPTFMYKDLLGFVRNTTEVYFQSPFPRENRLALIVPRTTTKFTSRNPRQYQEIASICTEFISIIPGNVALFFTSYHFRDIVVSLVKSQKPLLLEKSGATKSDRSDLLDAFKKHKDKGAALLCVSSGSFGEGIDLPGDLLQGVVVVGMPFKAPDLETQELIKYYDAKFGKGWDYGYVLPAIARSLQNAGRCIRSETDRGVIVFLDERYALPKYRRCFPPEWQTEICKNYRQRIQAFFSLPLQPGTL